MKKRILAISLVVAMLAVAVIGGSLAYFTDKDENINTFTYGNVDISLDETDITNPQGDRVTANHYENLIPGREFVKDPIVHNDGSTDAYVRVTVRIENGFNWAGFATGNPALPNSEENFHELFGELGEGWEYTAGWFEMSNAEHSDSPCFYTLTYTKALAPGASTPPAFSSFTVPVNLTQENIHTHITTEGDFEILVTAEAVQTETFESAAEAFAATFDKPATP